MNNYYYASYDKDHKDKIDCENDNIPDGQWLNPSMDELWSKARRLRNGEPEEQVFKKIVLTKEEKSKRDKIVDECAREIKRLLGV